MQVDNAALTQAIPPSRTSHPELIDALLCTQLTGRRLIRARLRRAAWHLVNAWCIWSGALRSCLGHIHIQAPIETPHVDFGALYERSPDGSYRESVRTHARAECIKKLEATFPWVDFVDRRIFLMGFDAAEQMNAHHSRTEDGRRNVVQQPNS